jgi:hypothetical protein
MRALALASLLVAGAAGCVAAPKPAPMRRASRTSGQQCTNLCQSMGLSLASVVVVRDQAGCVCDPGSAGTAHWAGAYAAAGAIVAIQEEIDAAAMDEQMREQQALMQLEMSFTPY